jgi:hypothetical protein
MDIIEYDIESLQQHEKEMLSQLEGLEGMIDSLNNRDQDVEFKVSRSSAVVHILVDWEEHNKLLSILQGLRDRVKKCLEDFYKTRIGERGTTIGIALDFSNRFQKENIDVCVKKFFGEKGSKKTGDKNGK